MTVGMAAGQGILSPSQGCEQVAVLQVAVGELAIARACASFCCQEQVLRQRVGLIPTVGGVLAGTPGDLTTDRAIR